MEHTPSHWLFCTSQPYCLQINMTPCVEQAPIQLDWRPSHKKDSRLYLTIGNRCRLLSDGDFTVFRLTEIQWQAVIAGKIRAKSEQWERLPFTVSELAVHPEFATFTAIGITEIQLCEK
ncbi:hypothetical protein [Xenorhabdus siamensis]|uniref:hypothetical protein n=1 Tax=Xenorhabdus siamensis TaxID=3136254 RepID=UPI0030F40446